MLPLRVLPHTADVVHPAMTPDRYNVATPDYGAAATTTAGVPCWMQSYQQTERLAERDVVVTFLHMVTNQPGIAALDHVTWQGDTYEVQGDPACYSTPNESPHHFTATLRKVTG